MKKSVSGFTIVELLVAIIVIGILAAITVVAYTGIQKRAAEGSLKSDLSNAAKQLEIDRAFLQQYPASLTAADDGKGVKASKGNTLTYTLIDGGEKYCLSATSSKEGVPSFTVSSEDAVPQQGNCPIPAPIAVTLTQPNSYTAVLTWNFTPPYNNFTWQRATNSSFSGAMSNAPGQNMGSTSQTTYNLHDSTIASGTTYYYRVRANTPQGPTSWSNTLTITIP